MENWKASKRIVVYSSVEQLDQFISNSIANNNLSLGSYEVRKIIKDHGNKSKEAPRGQGEQWYSFLYEQWNMLSISQGYEVIAVIVIPGVQTTATLSSEIPLTLLADWCKITLECCIFNQMFYRRNFMLFSSTTFLFVFLPIILGVYYTLLRNKRHLQNIFLFIASIIFYAWGEPIFVFLMLLSIALNYFFGLYVGSKRDKPSKTKLMLALAISVNLLVLFIFKYLTFTLTNINKLAGFPSNIPQITLPIGISFFTFQAISYVIDVYRGEPHQKSILNVGLYISFFPQLIAGPIVRYETVVKDISDRKETFSDFSDGVLRFVIGLGKKVLIANTMAVVADLFFDSDATSLSALSAWVGVLAYTFQIFFDFSGYSDMAIGLGKMFGFHFLENFDYPYISFSITEFWRRWHISLGTWFRDYLYIPLGGSRVKRSSRMIFNLFVVWLMTGIWHGANWTFVFWGLMYFVLLVAEKLTGIHQFKKLKAIRYVYTIFFVMIGWVFFRSVSITNAFQYIAAMFGANGVSVDNIALFYLKENAVCFVLAAILSTPLVRWFNRKYLTSQVSQAVVTIVLLLVFFLSVVYIVKGTYNPFIYFNF